MGEASRRKAAGVTTPNPPMLVPIRNLMIPKPMLEALNAETDQLAAECRAKGKPEPSRAGLVAAAIDMFLATIKAQREKADADSRLVKLPHEIEPGA